MTAAMKVATYIIDNITASLEGRAATTYIIDNITASLEGRAAILVIMVVETFKTNVIVFHR